MSSKTKTIATKEKAKPALVTKLRFPEFRGPWVKKRLEEVAPLQRGFDLPSDLIRPGSIPIVYSNGIQKYHEVGMATAPGLVTGRSGTIGKLHFIESGEYWPHNTSLWVTDFKGNVPRFVYYLYDSIGMGRFSSGSGVPTLNRNDVHAFSSLVPSSPAEQQKIAECLSSVDELIAAQARKVDALKAHKKGLMQQLFPREGQTQPRLRFPEFQNAGGWESRTIGEMFNLINGCAFKPEDWKSTGAPIIRIQNLNDPSAEFNYSQAPVPERNRVESGDLLFAWSGTLGSSFGARIWNGPSGVLNQHIFKVLMDMQQITLQFALLVLARVEEEIARRTHGFKASFVHVKKSDLVKVEMLLPSVPEQQHIATCFSSLDDLIAAQTQKLEALKTHKQGLMQQLFPSPEE